MHRRSVALIGALLILSTALFAQVERGTIVGRVTDSTGLAVPGAEITVHNTGTNVSFQTKSDEAGGFIAPTLNAGQYEVTVKMQGFRAETHRGILIEVGQRVRADFTLQPGQVTETIDVTAEAPLIQNETSALGTVIAQKTIAELPLNGRSFISLLTLSSGITPGTPGRLLGGRGTQVQRGSSAFSANGMRDTSNNFLIDGIDNNEMAVSTIMYFPSVDAIQEFKVQTSASDAEFGRNGGGTVNLSIKSGSNDLHGTVYEFLRNEKMDAKNFFDPPSKKIPPLKRNQYGFSLGGPIKRNKLFLFGDYEGKRYVEAQTYVNSIATNAQRAGDFTGFNPIFDPATTGQPGPNTRSPFPDNKIPANRLSGPAKFYAALLPQPNVNTKLNNFVFNPNRTTHGEQFDVKADLYFTNNDTLALRYSYAWFKLYQPVDLPGEAGGDGFRFSGNNSSPSHQVALTHTHLFSPSLVNTVRVGFTRLTIDQVSLNYGKNLTEQAGIPGVNLTDFSSGLMAVTIPGYSSMGDSGFTPCKLFQNNYHLQENLAWNRSEHSVKFGVDVRRRYLNFFQVSAPRGSMAFGNEVTRQPSAPTGTGDAFASFMLGLPNSGSINRFVTGPYGQRYTEFGVFVKDDWKVTSNLTLNLGLRYELMTPLIEKYDRMSNFDFATGRIVPGGTNGWPRGGVETDKNNFAPRFGFAWSPMGSRRISIHGGAGIFYNIEASAGGKRLSENAPFLVTPSFNNDLNLPTRTMSQGFPILNVDLNNPSGISAIAWDRDFVNGYVLQYNLTLETEVARNLVVRNMYVANRGVHLFATANANQPLPGATPIASRRPYPNLTNISYHQPRGNSTYHSWQLQVERRFARGLSFLSALTLGKAIDDNSGAFNDNDAGGGARAEDVRNYRLDKSLSDFHIGKRFVNSFVWELPFGKGMRWGSSWSGFTNAILGGWQTNGVLTLQDGNPFSATGPDQTNGGSGDMRPNRLGNGNLPSGERTVQRWFDKTAFAIPTLYNFGTSGRNILFTPGLKLLDFSTFKNFRLTEKMSLQFRAEFFNFTNTPYLGAPGRRIDQANAGVISTARNPRNTQLGLKIVF